MTNDEKVAEVVALGRALPPAVRDAIIDVVVLAPLRKRLAELHAEIARLQGGQS